jgi:ADP-heptose:LPS heptosyltransferase
MSTGPFPILFIAPSDPIDAMFASGVFKRLHDEIDNAAFTVVADPASAPLFRDAPKREVTILRQGRGLSQTMSLWMQLRRRRWGLVLDADGGKLAGWVPAKKRARPRPDDGAPVHKVIAAARLLKLEEEPPAPFLFVSDKVEARAREILGEGGGPLLALSPGAPWIGRAWPPERFARTAAQLLGERSPLSQGRLLIVGAAEDWKAAESLRRSIVRERWIDLTGEKDPLLVHACLAKARLFIGGATLYAHMAASAGAPTIALFGPNDETIERPWGDQVRAIRGPRSFKALQASDPGLDQPVCHMLDLPVETVGAAALELLKQTAPGKRKHG